MRAVAVIPARYASTRFPGKPLAAETGKLLIQHVYERAAEAPSIEQVIVATDDERIVEAVESFGGEVAMTRSDHASGTERVAEVAATLRCDIVVNLQGDEPEIDPAYLDRLVALLTNDPAAEIATLACPFTASAADPAATSAVKVVNDIRGRALYFSRSLIPFAQPNRPAAAVEHAASPLLHLGLYAYRRDVLLDLARLAPTPLEQSESLEQLRWLEHGRVITVAVVDRATVGIDTPEDYAAFVKRCRRTAGVN